MRLSVRQRFWRGVWVALKRRPSRILGVIIMALFVFMAIAGPWFYPDRLPYNVDNMYAPISWDHPLSTDFEGVDVLALVITGTRGVLLVAVAAGLVTMLVGTAAGLYAGYRRGAADSVLMRIADFALTIPGFPLLIVLTTAMNFGAWWKMALVLGLIGWGGLARAVRSQTLSLRERGFIEAARGLGLPTRHIVTKELLPNVAPFIATNLLMAVTGYIYAQVGLYFLGVLPLDTSNWGVMLNAAVFQSGALISPDALPYLLAPLGAILLLTLGVVLIVDALEEIFNPRLREG
ncbi:peptide ABC transporter permease [Rhizocola hellebori]|uniref:Peptide ABC transporter permease n=1 Tax=Rhizocola hellebori TaxID=1392758 RepID=A0A8J3QLM3_9ACTN|nr:ABC transporter permease [Rhizocola hellebori]GIH11708.1 peptide ABC transporter permease [Rhizocola hellebori]